jgi:hypothetical protein
MTTKEILKLAIDCHTKAKTRDFRGQMKPFESWMVTWIIEFYKVSTSMERENCAKLCDEFQERDVGMQPAECAGAIRQMEVV